MKKYQIKTPLLHYCLLYFGSLSLPLLPIRPKNRKSLLHFLWNCLLFVLCMQKILDWVEQTYIEDKPGNVFYQDKRHKPLYNFLVIFTDRYISPLCEALIFVYFVYINNKNNNLIELLDSLYLTPSAKSKTKQNFTTILLLFNGLVIASNCKVLYANVETFASQSALYNGVTIYLVIVNRYIPALALHYVQFSTFSELKTAVTKYASKQTGSETERYALLRAEVVRLASLNAQLYRLLALPLLVLVFTYVLELLYWPSLYGSSGQVFRPTALPDSTGSSPVGDSNPGNSNSLSIKRH